MTPPSPPRQPRRDTPPPGQNCPLHGWYETPTPYYQLRERANNPDRGHQPRRDDLEAADRARRHCPTCAQPAPRTWAATFAASRNGTHT